MCTGKSASQHAGLTALPVSGRSRQGTKSGRKFAYYTCKLDPSYVQRFGHEHSVPVAAPLSLSWAFILSAYSSSKDEIVFRVREPGGSNLDSSYDYQFKIHQYKFQPKSHLTILQSLQNLCIWTEGKGLGDAEHGQECEKVGTLLDLSSLSHEHALERRGGNGPSYGSAMAVVLRIKPGSTDLESISLEIEASTDIVSKDAARLLLAQYEAVLRVILEHPQSRTEDLALALPYPLLSIMNDAPVARKSHLSLQSQFEGYACSDPDVTALEFWNDVPFSTPRTWTYATLDFEAEKLAMSLEEFCGSLADKIVPICLHQSPDLYIAILAILKAGAAWCPIDPSFPPRRRHELIERVNAEVVMANETSPVGGVPAGVRVFDMSRRSPDVSERPRTKSSPLGRLAYLIWTSGSTGPPKGVPISHEAAVASMLSLQNAIPRDVKDGRVRCLQFSQSTFDVFIQDLFYTWGVGGIVIAAGKSTMLGSFAELATAAKATHAHLTPAFASSVSRSHCPTLQVVTMIGEALTEHVADDWSKDCRLYNTYGPAEATVVATVRHVQPHEATQSSNIGYPLQSVTLWIINQGKIVIRGGVGELALSGPQLAEGYWDDGEKTSEKFIYIESCKRRVYMTGDIVRQLHDGSLNFIGRTDDLVKIQGIRIELSEIAYALRFTDPRIAKIAVDFLYRPDRPSQVIVCFLAVPQLGARNEGILMDEVSCSIVRKLKAAARVELPEYMVPKVFLTVAEVPLTASNKIDRAALKDLYCSCDVQAWEDKLQLGPDQKHDQITGNAEDTWLFQLVSDLTGTETTAMSKRSSLASVGIDSITATRLVSALRKQQIMLSIQSILESNTLGDLLALLTDNSSSDLSRSIAADSPGQGPSTMRHPRITKLSQELIHHLDPELGKKIDCVLPALSIQEALLSETMQRPTAYWSTSVYALGNEINLDLLATAWTQIIRGTEALRTAFIPIAILANPPATNATFLQITYKEPTMSLNAVDAEVVDDLQSDIREESYRVAKRRHDGYFIDPPWAAWMIRQGVRRYMVVTIHHSLRDEASLEMLMDDLEMTYYNPSDQSSLSRVQLSDAVSIFSCTEEQRAEDERFWGAELPVNEREDFTNTWPDLRIEERSYEHGTITHCMQSTMSYSRLATISQDFQGISVASVLRLVWGFLSLRYLESDTAVLGETISLRNQSSRMTDVIGPLFAVLPYTANSRQSLRQALLLESAFHVRSKAHSSISPALLRKALGVPRGVALYPTIFNFVVKSKDDPQTSSPALWTEMNIDTGLEVEHPLALTVLFRDGDTLDFEFIAKAQYVDQVHLELLGLQYDALLDLSSRNLDMEMSLMSDDLDMSLLSVSEPRIKAEGNITSNTNPAYWVNYYAQYSPENIAAEVVSNFQGVGIESEKWTYRELHDAYRSIATTISGYECSKQMIAVCIDRRLDVYAVVLAIMSTGNVYVPIAEDLPADRKSFLAQDSDASLLFTTKSLADTFSSLSSSCRTIIVEDIDYRAGSSTVAELVTSPSDAAYLLYTSGSTGRPKGVLVSRSNFVLFIEAISHFINDPVDMRSVGQKGKWLGMASFAFDVHLLEMFFPWRFGFATITAQRHLLLDDLELAFQRLGITHASLIPSLVENSRLDPKNLPDLRYLSVGGEKISKRVIDTFADSHVVLANAYGPTEATIGCCFARVKPSSSIRNIGTPLDYTTAHVLDFDSSRYTLRGTAGELCLTGDLVAKGYHKRPDAKGFVKNFKAQRMYRTGDRVRMLADGSLEFLGRKDEQTKLRGQRLELGEVTETVRTVVEQTFREARIEVATLVLKNSPTRSEQLIAFLAIRAESGPKACDEEARILTSQNDWDEEEMLSLCEEQLPSFMVPSRIFRLNYLPVAQTSRKVDSKRLRQMCSDFFEASSTVGTGEASRNPPQITRLEATIRDVAAEVLQNQAGWIEPGVNLFSLGLDSLNVVGLTIRLRKLGYLITISDILQAPTVRSIASVIRAENTTMGKDEQRLQAAKVESNNCFDSTTVVNLQPCLPLQESLIAGSLSTEDSPLYVNHAVLSIDPAVDRKQLESAWRATVSDCEILRTCFHEVDGQFLQVILKQHQPIFGLVEKTEDVETWRVLQTREIVSKLHLTPPYRLLWEINSSQRRLHILIHHSLYDAQAFSLILDHVYSQYNGQEPESHLPMSTLISHVKSQDLRKAESFWKSYLYGIGSRLIIPQGASADSSSDVVSRVLSHKDVENLAASLSVTTSSLLQTVFGVALVELYRINDIVFGTVLSGRNVPIEGADSIIGPCIATIPQRIEIPHSCHLRSLVSSAHQGFAKSIEFQHTRLKDISRRTEAQGPLFDALFSYTHKPSPPRWAAIFTETASSMPLDFSLGLEIVGDPDSDQMVMRCKFTACLVTREKAITLVERMEELLQRLLREEDVQLGDEISSHSKRQRSSVPATEPSHAWSEQEKIIANTVRSILGNDLAHVKRGTSFFAMGIDSILAIRFSKDLVKSGLQCSSADIMRNPNIEKLARTVAIRGHNNLQRQSSLSGDGERSATTRTFASENSYPCTPLQSSMLTQTLGSEGSLYVHQHIFMVAGDAHLDRLEKAWETLIKRTDIFRTTFRFLEDKKAWLAKVHRSVDWRWHSHDRSSSLEQTINQIQENFTFRRQTDFEKPPWAVDVLHEYWILTMHHSLYDGESVALILRDLIALYEQAEVPCRPLFSEAVRSIQRIDLSAEHYWLKQVESYAGALLPILPQGQFKFSQRRLNLDVDQLLYRCRNLDVTLQSVSLLTFARTLAVLMGRDDIVFGHVVRGRTLPDIDSEDVIGPMFNTIPLRIKFDNPERTKAAMLKDIQNLTGESQDHQHADLGKIKSLWREALNDNERQLIESIFTFQRLKSSENHDLLKPVLQGNSSAPTEYAINVELCQSNHDLELTINASVVKDLEAFVQLFEVTMRDILHNPRTCAYPLYQDSSMPTLKRIDEPQILPQERSEIPGSLICDVKQVLSEVSNTPRGKIQEEMSIFSLGLDSLSAITVASFARSKGLSITVADILRGRTVRGIAQQIVNSSAERSTTAGSTRAGRDVYRDYVPSQVAATLGLQVEEIASIQPCFPGQSFHLATWLKSARTLGEGVFTFRSQQTLDAQKLSSAWHTLCVRNPILRTVFIATPQKETVQVVLKTPVACLREIKVNGLQGSKLKSLTDLISQETANAFDLYSVPARVILVQYLDSSCVLLHLHHALYDAMTLPRLIRDLCVIYEHSDAVEIAISQPNEVTALPLSSTACRDYWLRSLHDAKPTIISSRDQTSHAEGGGFYFESQVIPGLAALEDQCKRSDLSPQVMLLVAFARAVASHANVPNPSFGLYQAGRSSLSESSTQCLFPCLNLLPLTVYDAGSHDVRRIHDRIQKDLADRVPYEQTYVGDILQWIGFEKSPLFNSFINILWNKPTDTQSLETYGNILEPSTDIDPTDFAPRKRVPGKGPLEGFDASFLADANMSLDAKRDEIGDCIRLVARCDKGVMGPEDAENFVATMVAEVGRCIKTL